MNLLVRIRCWWFLRRLRRKLSSELRVQLPIDVLRARITDIMRQEIGEAIRAGIVKHPEFLVTVEKDRQASVMFAIERDVAQILLLRVKA